MAWRQEQELQSCVNCPAGTGDAMPFAGVRGSVSTSLVRIVSTSLSRSAPTLTSVSSKLWTQNLQSAYIHSTPLREVSSQPSLVNNLENSMQAIACCSARGKPGKPC